MEKLFVKILNKFKLLKKINTQAFIYVYNKKIIIPIIGGLGYGNLFLSEPWMTNVLEKLKPIFNGNFIDIGVNVGQTLIKAYSVFEEVNYIGFEPNPSCIYYCQELIKTNGFLNCTILPVGIGKKTTLEKLNFYSNDTTDPSASIINKFRPDQKIWMSSYVPIFNLDNFYPLLPSEANPFLKIDVEGSELEVLFGMKDYLIKNEPIILIEVLPVYSLDNHFRVDRNKKLVVLLSEMGYIILRILKNSSVSIQKLPDFGIHSDLDKCDYLLCPANLEQRIINCFVRS